MKEDLHDLLVALVLMTLIGGFVLFIKIVLELM